MLIFKVNTEGGLKVENLDKYLFFNILNISIKQNV